VVDFGVSKVLDGDGGPATATDGVAGTAAYMAPEHARAVRDASFLSDQYSLAVILYECVTGELPFSGDSMYELLRAVMTAPLPAPSLRAAGVPPELDAIVLRAMSRNPRDRFPSVRGFGAALLPLARESNRLAWSVELHAGPDEPASPRAEPMMEASALEPATQPPMPPTARDTNAAFPSRAARRGFAALVAAALAVGVTAAWSSRHGREFSRAEAAASTVSAASVAEPSAVPAVASSATPPLATIAEDIEHHRSTQAPAVAAPPAPQRPRGTPPAAFTAKPAPSASMRSASPSMGDNGAPILPP
jgi:serine/threonine-protein kinase